MWCMIQQRAMQGDSCSFALHLSKSREFSKKSLLSPYRVTEQINFLFSFVIWSTTWCPVKLTGGCQAQVNEILKYQ